MRTKAFTFAEVLIASALSMILMGMIAAGIIWLRNGMRTISSVDRDAELLWLSRVLNQDLNSARSFQFPTYKEDSVAQANQVIFTDVSGDVSMIYVDRRNRLVQFSYSRNKFRDLLTNVDSFRVFRPEQNQIRYEVSRKLNEKVENIHAIFEIESGYAP